MICIAALIIFGILGIFSASHRKIAKEAIDCVMRRVTLKPCNTGMDKRLRAELSGKLMKKNPSIAKFVYKYFEVFSWIFLIIFALSIVYTAIGGYNYAIYGDCNGLKHEGVCIFNPNVGDSSKEGEIKELIPMKPTGESPRIYYGDGTPELTIVEFGCFVCPNTKKIEPALKELLKKRNIAIEYHYFPITSHPNSEPASRAAECAYRQNRFEDYKELLFERQEQIDPSQFTNWAIELEMDANAFNECMEARGEGSAYDKVQLDFTRGKHSNVYGTPTIFYGDKAIVGVQPFKKLNKLIK